MKPTISATLLLLILAPFVFTQNTGKAIEAYNQGLRFQELGDTANATKAYDRAITLDPKLVDAYNNRATLRLGNGDTAGAIADLSKVIDITPKHALSFYNRGNIYLEAQDYDAAIEDFTRAIAILDGLTNAYDRRAHAMAFNNRGNARMAKEDAKSALADYERSLEIMPGTYEALTGIGSARQSLGDLAGAVADYTKALKAFPDNRLILMNRAGALEEIDPAAAIADYSRVIELDPKNALAYARRGIVHLNKGEKSKAAADIRKAIQMDAALSEEFGVFLKEAGSK